MLRSVARSSGRSTPVSPVRSVRSRSGPWPGKPGRASPQGTSGGGALAEGRKTSRREVPQPLRRRRIRRASALTGGSGWRILRSGASASVRWGGHPTKRPQRCAHTGREVGGGLGRRRRTAGRLDGTLARAAAADCEPREGEAKAELSRGFVVLARSASPRIAMSDVRSQKSRSRTCRIDTRVGPESLSQLRGVPSLRGA